MAELNDHMIHFIRESIRLEINGRRFFEHAETITENELGKKMFRKLAKDEIEHLRVFSDIYTRMLGGDWKKFVNTQEADAASDLIDRLAPHLDKKGKEKHSGELEALRIGMELERQAIDFFKQAAADAQDAATRDIFSRISQEEERHYDLLQAQYDSLHNSGFWFDVAEFQMDGKY